MASMSNVLRTCGLLFYIIFQVHASVNITSELSIQSVNVGSVTCDNKNCKYLLNVTGGEFLGHSSWRLTPEEGAKGGKCDVIYPNYEVKEIETSQWFSKLEVFVPLTDGKIFFCLNTRVKSLPFGGDWVHQGVKHFLEPKNDVDSSNKEALPLTDHSKSSSSQDLETDTQKSKTLQDIADQDKVQENIKNDVQETKTDWADLTHDIDVNYLPSVPRPTREEKNNIEVLINHKFVPLNDLIEQIKTNSNLKNVFNNENEIESSSININKHDVKDTIETIQEDVNRNIFTLALNDANKADKLNLKYKTNNNSNEIIDEELDALKFKLHDVKCDKIIADIKEIIEKINSLPNHKSVRDILAQIFPDYIMIQKYLADNYVQEIFAKSLIEMSEESMAKNKEDDLNIKTKMNNDTKVMYNEDFDPIQVTKCDKIIADIKNIIEELNSLPNYNNVLDILAQIFPNYMSIQRNLAHDYVKKILTESLYEISEKSLSQTDSKDNFIQENFGKFPKDTVEIILSDRSPNEKNLANIKDNFIQEKLIISTKGISIENILAESFPKDSMEIILANRFQNDLLSKENFPYTRNPRQAMPEVDFTSVKAGSRMIMIEGIRIEDSKKEPKIIEDGIPSVLAESSVTLRVYGDGLTPHTVIAFTHDPQPYGQPCKFLVKGEYMVKEGSLQGRTALFDIRTPAPITASKLYICAKNLRPGISDPILDEEKYLHQGTETWKMIATHNQLLPLWVAISLILFCLSFSALFSGLNLGLMSLDRTELKIISNTGTEQERKYARAIMPVRDHGNYLLCSILLGNVAVNSTFTILLDELTSGLFAVIFSTLAIVMLGEITPQAICSRHGLMVGAKSIMITKGVMALTAPLSFPVSKLLDYFLGEEIGNVYNRERLKELVKVTTDVNDLDKDEVNIISGALEMRKKTVKDVMTKLEDVFMLPISSVLDFETMSEIVKSGYSRIPVHEGGRGNIVTVLFIKDLAFVDPDDNTPLRTLCQYYQNATNFVFEDVTLDVMFKQFKDGHKGHMAFVHRINNEGEGDPFYETIGLVTLEDVIEEMIQSEIVDETDVFLDNRSKRRRRPQNKLQDFAAFAERHENQRIHISPQLTLATFQFLSTSVDAFRPDTVSETVLRRLLRQDVIQYIKIKGKTKKDPTTFVFQQGKPVDYFLLILEGRVEVTVGRENLVFEAGPFTYFGVQALTQNIGVAESPTPSAMGSLQNINMDAMLRHTFVPDYSVRAITSLYYLTVKRSLYLAAKRATLMEKGNISKGGTTQEFDTEVDKLLESVDEDLSITGEHKTPSRQVSPNPIAVPPSPRALEPRNGHAYAPTSSDEQERLLK